MHRWPKITTSTLTLLALACGHCAADQPGETTPMDGGREALFALISEARERGIVVEPIPVLDADQGYFPNATNAQEYADLVDRVAEQWASHGLEPSTLIVDMEPPKELTEALSGLDILEAMPRRHIDEPRFERARTTFAELVTDLQGRGWKVAVSTQGSLLGDYRDGERTPLAAGYSPWLPRPHRAMGSPPMPCGRASRPWTLPST